MSWMEPPLPCVEITIFPSTCSTFLKKGPSNPLSKTVAVGLSLQECELMENEVKAKMQAALDHFKQELKNLRTNRANPGVVEGVTVEVYGTQMKIKELA